MARGSPALPHGSRLALWERQVSQSRKLCFHTAPTSIGLNELQTPHQQLWRLYHHQICGFPPAQRQLPLYCNISATGERARGTARARGTLQTTITQPRGNEITGRSRSRRVTFSVCPPLPLPSYGCKQARSLRGRDHSSHGLRSRREASHGYFLCRRPQHVKLLSTWDPRIRLHRNGGKLGDTSDAYCTVRSCPCWQAQTRTAGNSEKNISDLQQSTRFIPTVIALSHFSPVPA